MLIIGHRCGHASLETASFEVKSQVLAQQLQFLELLLLVMDLSSVGFDLLVQLCLVSLHGCDL